jgi:hypothetical protein
MRLAGAPAESGRPVSPDGSAEGAPACPNCGSGVVETFCVACGERQPSQTDYTVRHLMSEAYAEFVSVDGRLWRSIVLLLSRPGLLTREYFAGRRGRYMRPFSLFVLLNLGFFFVQPYTGLFNYDYALYVRADARANARAEVRRQELFLPPRRFVQRFDDELQNQKRSILLVAVPLFALALLVLYAFSERTYVEHLVFSIHAYAFLLFYLTAMGTILFGVLRLLRAYVPASRPLVQFLGHESGVELMLTIGMIGYLTLALRRYYESPLLPALLRGVALFGVFVMLLAAFQNAVFYTTLWAM